MAESYLNLPAIVTSLLVLSLAAIGLNTLSIYIITTVRKLWSKTSNLLLLNLLVVHLFQGLFVLPLYAGKKFRFPKSQIKVAQFFANGFRLSYMLTFYGTCLGILSIAFDRFLATYLLTKYKTIVTRKRVTIALILLWIYIFGLCLIPFVDVSSEYKIKYNQTTNTSIKTEKLKFYVYNPQKEWVLFMLIVNTAIPYVFIILCYTYIVYRLQRMGAYTEHTTRTLPRTFQFLNGKGENVTMKNKDLQKHKQVIKLTLILTFLYGIFWTPSIIYYPMKEDCKECFPEDYEDSEVEQYVGFITKYLAMLDAAAAPLLYCFMHKEFQYAMKRIQSKLMRQQPACEQVSRDSTNHEITDMM